MRKCHVVLRGAFLAACACVIASAARAQDLTGSVEGVLLRADDGRPIRDAVVGLFGLGRYTTSDSTGHFLLSGVRFGGAGIHGSDGWVSRDGRGGGHRSCRRCRR